VKEEILAKAIERAISNGWRPTGFAIHKLNPDRIVEHMFELEGWTVDEWYEGSGSYSIFNHDFAKALWGKEIIDTGMVRVNKDLDYEAVTMPLWKFYLHQMVIAEDPIKYLGENI
jgi:hypothetical protein